MITEPKIEKRNELKYLAIKTQVKMKEISEKLQPLIPELFEWLRKENINPAGSLFFHYSKINGDLLDVEVGVPVNSFIKGDNRIQPGLFLPGNYILTTYTGNYMNLPRAHAELEKWKEKNNIKAIGPRTEFYITDPETEPDPVKWQTDIVQQIKED